jgi:hypothetical protein
MWGKEREVRGAGKGSREREKSVVNNARETRTVRGVGGSVTGNRAIKEAEVEKRAKK